MNAKSTYEFNGLGLDNNGTMNAALCLSFRSCVFKGWQRKINLSLTFDLNRNSNSAIEWRHCYLPHAYIDRDHWFQSIELSIVQVIKMKLISWLYWSNVCFISFMLMMWRLILTDGMQWIDANEGLQCEGEKLKWRQLKNRPKQTVAKIEDAYDTE